MRFIQVLLLLLLFSCRSGDSSDASFVDEDKIYQQYVVEYDENNSELFASASFRFGGDGGTTLVVDSAGEISFNGKPMKRAKYLMGGVFYKLAQKDSGSLLQKYLFRMKTADGDIIENAAQLLPLDIRVPENINVNEDLSLEFNNADLRDSELLIIEIADTATDLKLSFGRQDIRDKRILIKSQALKAINGVEATFSIRRSGDFPLTQPFKQGGFIRSTYIQKKRQVKFIRNAGS